MSSHQKNPGKIRSTVRSVLAGFDAGARVRHGAQVPKDHPARRRS